MLIVLQDHRQIGVSDEFPDSPDIDARSNGLCNKSMAQVIRTNPSLYTRTEGAFHAKRRECILRVFLHNV